MLLPGFGDEQTCWFILIWPVYCASSSLLADVGGFFNAPGTELLLRWYQAGSFMPFFRSHAHMDTPRREPWLHGADNTKLIRDIVRQRYTFLPFWYQQFYHSYKTGEPIMRWVVEIGHLTFLRPFCAKWYSWADLCIFHRMLWLDYPKETATFAIDDEFLIGEAFSHNRLFVVEDEFGN